MFAVKAAEEKDLNFIKDMYKLLDTTMMDLLKQLVDIDEDGEDEQHSDKYWNDLIQEKTGYVLVAFYEKEPAGIVVVEIKDEQEVHLEDLIVSPEFQKRGIGKLLIGEAKKIACQKGYKKISLNVLPNNENAKDLYTKQGFQNVKISMVCTL